MVNLILFHLFNCILFSTRLKIILPFQVTFKHWSEWSTSELFYNLEVWKSNPFGVERGSCLETCTIFMLSHKTLEIIGLAICSVIISVWCRKFMSLDAFKYTSAFVRCHGRPNIDIHVAFIFFDHFCITLCLGCKVNSWGKSIRFVFLAWEAGRQLIRAHT